MSEVAMSEVALKADMAELIICDHLVLIISWAAIVDETGNQHRLPAGPSYAPPGSLVSCSRKSWQSRSAAAAQTGEMAV
jgi:hypothetical protein